MRRQYRQATESDMNCIAATKIQLLLIAGLALLVSDTAIAAESNSPPSANERTYVVDYRITPDVSRSGAYVELKLAQNRRLLRELSMPNNPEVISDIEGDGDLAIDDERIRWRPEDEGGRLSWFAKVNHLRNGDGYDAFVGDEWALFRAEDVIPPTATRALSRSSSKTRLTFNLPNGWTAVSEYFQRSGVHDVSIPDRRFDKPRGWIVLGHLGVRNETIAGVRVVVAAPVGHSVRRMDVLAMFNWTIPDLLRLLPRFPKRLTVVSAGEPMWRGALSAPRSFYVHVDRPLISENGTSTFMHEAVHIGLGVDAVEGADWIVEGLAEYYGLEILRRSGTISEKRYRSARSRMANWGEKAQSLCADPSTGEVTARAVSLLAELNDEIRKNSDRQFDLDDVVQRIANFPDKISRQKLFDVTKDLTGSDSEVLSDKSLNNCEN